jgi:hypothetical protein
MISYAVLALLATLLNWQDGRMLSLVALVTAGIFAPVPDANFYLICADGEVLIGLLAFRLGATASRPVLRISALLVIFHGLGYLLNGYPPASPYHVLVRICEHAELLACIVMSGPILKRWCNV